MITKEQDKKAPAKKGKALPNRKLNKPRINPELKRAHTTHHQYKNTVEHQSEYIKELEQLSFAMLGKRLDIIRQQMQWAFEQEQYDTYELLQLWEEQTIIARLHRFDKEVSKRENKNCQGK